MRLLPLLLSALLLSACGAPGATSPGEEPGEVPPLDAAMPSEAVVAEPEPEPEPVRLPPVTVCLYDVDDAARAEVERGVLGWARTLAPWRDVVLSDGDDCGVTIFEVGAHAGICADDGAAGCTTQIGGLEQAAPSVELFLYRGQFEEFAAGAVMHELGHLLGLTHRDGGLMQASWPAGMRGADWECPDPESVARLERLLGADGLVACALPAPAPAPAPAP